jgi:hypothetical protein
MKCIFIGKECFFYYLKDHDIVKDIAILDLYKNKGDLKNKIILRTIEIKEWSDKI